MLQLLTLSFSFLDMTTGLRSSSGDSWIWKRHKHKHCHTIRQHWPLFRVCCASPLSDLRSFPSTLPPPVCASQPSGMASTLQTANKIVVKWPDQKIIELLREKISSVPAGLLCLVLHTLLFLHKAPIMQKPWRSLVGSPWRLLPTSQRTERDAMCQARTWPNCTLRKREQINSLYTKYPKNIWSSSRLPAESDLTGKGLKTGVWSALSPEPASRGEAPVLRVLLLLPVPPALLPSLQPVHHDWLMAVVPLTETTVQSLRAPAALQWLPPSRDLSSH